MNINLLNKGSNIRSNKNVNTTSFSSDRYMKHPKASIYQQKFHDLIQNDEKRDKFKVFIDPDDFIYNLGFYRNLPKE